MSEQHSPLPWYRADKHPAHIAADTGTGRILTVITPRGEYQLRAGWSGMSIPEDEHAANAAFIVKAVNSHEALVMALELVRDLAVMDTRAFENVQAALKIAKGG